MVFNGFESLSCWSIFIVVHLFTLIDLKEGLFIHLYAIEIIISLRLCQDSNLGFLNLVILLFSSIFDSSGRDFMFFSVVIIVLRFYLSIILSSILIFFFSVIMVLFYLFFQNWMLFCMRNNLKLIQSQIAIYFFSWY